jgi:hypothetical protein
MDIKTEAKHAAAFLLSEGGGQISREAVTVIAGDALPAGQVLGIVSASGKHAPYDGAAEDGTEVAAGVLYAPLAASEDDRPAVAVVRLAEVTGAELTGLDVAGGADLKSRYIIVR